MSGYLVPFIVVVALPAIYVAHRCMPRRGSGARRLGGLLLLGLLIASLPWGGVDLVYIKRLSLFLAAAAVGLVLVEPSRLDGLAARRRWMAALTLLAALSLVNFLNYFSFHGARTFVHLHDVAHYYLNAKYFRELGYSSLYIGMLRAEAEVYDDHFRAIEARDLESYDLVHIRELLQRSDPVKAAFSPQRWRDFRRDVAYFRDALGPLYGDVLHDHGFNPTPVWLLFGRPLANLVPAGSAGGILALCLLDPLLLAVLFAAVWSAVGARTALLALVHFCVIFGATFAWTGGAFLRYLWLTALVVAVTCLARRRDAVAGSLLALAAGLRVFPIFFALPLFLRAGWRWARTRRPPRRWLRFGASFAVTGLVLLAATLAVGGLDDWNAFRQKMSRHVDVLAPNVVGMTAVLSYRPGPHQVTAEELQVIEERRRTMHRLQLLTVFPATLLAVALLARRRAPLRAFALGLPLIVTAVDLAAYYYAFLIALTVVHRRSARNLALIFGLEVATYSLALFEEREAMIFVYRGLMVLFLALALELGSGGQRGRAPIASAGGLQ